MSIATQQVPNIISNLTTLEDNDGDNDNDRDDNDRDNMVTRGPVNNTVDPTHSVTRSNMLVKYSEGVIVLRRMSNITNITRR